MEAGYDYLLLRGRLQRRFFNVSGIFVFVFGAILLATSGAYYGYAAKAHADLDSLNVTLPKTNAKISVGPGSQGSLTETQIDQGQEGVYPLSTPVQSDGQSSSQAVAQAVEGTGTWTDGGSTEGSGAPKVTVGGASGDPGEDSVSASGSSNPLLVMPFSAISNQQLFPGESLQASFWSNPLSYESASYRERILLQGFNAVDLNQGLALGSGDPATRLIIPSIEVDSGVDELAILDLGGSRAYETPANTVGNRQCWRSRKRLVFRAYGKPHPGRGLGVPKPEQDSWKAAERRGRIRSHVERGASIPVPHHVVTGSTSRGNGALRHRQSCPTSSFMRAKAGLRPSANR